MAIVLNDNPGTYYSAHGDLLFSVYEAVKAIDPVTYPNYQYVCDIYIGGTLITRTKVYPHPTHKRGIFNIAPIVRAYLLAQLNPATSGVFVQSMASGEFFIDVQCKFGEDYDYTTYPNLLTDSSRTYYNHYNGQITSDESVLDGFIGNYLTNRPRTANVRFDDPYFFVPYAISGTITDITVNSYTAAGVLIDADTNSEAVTANACNILNLSPSAINTYFGSTIIPSTAAYYVVDMDGNEMRFDIVCEPMHEPYTLHFLNQFGGFESVSFNKKSVKTHDIERKEFSRLPYTINASTGAIEYGNAGNVVNETRVAFASRYTSKLKVSTDFLTDDEWTWLRELVMSTNVFITEGTKIIPVAVMASNYEVKKFINDKLQPLVLDLDYGTQLNTQYR
jgi:hypothetical protein